MQNMLSRQAEPEPGASNDPAVSWTPGPTAIGNKLVDLCAWKYISPQLLQKLADQCLQDVLYVISQVAPATTLALYEPEDIVKKILPGLHKLAKLGATGGHENNINRDLLRLLPPVPIPVQTIFLPLKLPGLGVRNIEQKAIWPHEMFDSLYRNNQPAFKLRMCPSATRLREFWASQVHHPNYPKLARLMRDKHGVNWQDKAVPFKTHGDGCPVTGVGKSWGESQDFVEWVSLVVPSNPNGY